MSSKKQEVGPSSALIVPVKPFNTWGRCANRCVIRDIVVSKCIVTFAADVAALFGTTRKGWIGIPAPIQLTLLSRLGIFIQRPLQATIHKALADALDRGTADTDGRHDLGIAQAFIGLEQDHRPLHFASFDLALAGYLEQFMPLFIT